jgi:O-antigen ligase
MMRMKRYDRKRKGKRTGKSELPKWLWVLPFFIGAGIVPAVVRGKVVRLYEKALELWQTQEGLTFDFFSYQKAVFLVYAGFIALALLIFKKVKEGFSDNDYRPYFIPLAAYALFVILSTLFSPYPKTSLNGFHNRYEGMLMLLSYILLALAAMLVLDKEERIKTVLWFIAIPSFLVTGIGVLQFFRLDPFRSAIGQWFIMNARMYAQRDLFSVVFNPGHVYSTLFNPNYVGSYCALMIPVFCGLLMYEKKIWKKALLVIGLVFGIINIYGSRSTAGLVGLLAFAALTAVFLLASRLRKHPAAIFSFMTVFAVAAGLFLFVNLTDYKGLGVIPDLKIEYRGDNPDYIRDIQISGSAMVIDRVGGKIEVQNNMGKLSFYDDAKKPLDAHYYNGKYTLADSRYSRMAFTISPDNMKLTVHVSPLSSFTVTMDAHNFYDFVGPLDKSVAMDRPASWFFDGYEKIGSGRGYIWSRSLPLMFTKRPLLGTGPDTYAYVFPQNDIIGKMNSGFDDNKILVDKPHNMYIQIGINTGLLSLLSIIVLFVVFIVQAFRLYWRAESKDSLFYLGMFLSAGCFGYMVTAFFNDSTVSVAPLFWVLFGCSVSIGHILKKRKEA